MWKTFIANKFQNPTQNHNLLIIIDFKIIFTEGLSPNSVDNVVSKVLNARYISKFSTESISYFLLNFIELIFL